MLAAPFIPPKQLTFVCDVSVATSAVGWVIVIVCDAVQPFASVAVHV